jgi:hypothetical protein
MQDLLIGLEPKAERWLTRASVENSASNPSPVDCSFFVLALSRDTGILALDNVFTYQHF